MELRTTIGKGGRVVIPAKFRHQLDLHEGDELLIKLEDHELRLLTLSYAIHQAQALVKKHNKSRKKLSEELIKERRAASKNE